VSLFVTWEDAVNWLKAQPDQQELVKACFYDDPLTVAAERYAASTEWSAVQKLLESVPKGAVLDLGAGRGIASYAFAQDGWRVTALEPDPSCVVGAGAIRSLAADSGLAIEVVESLGEQLPCASASFELVYARQALHHARDLSALCRELFRVLKPGGMLLATREHVISRAKDIDTFLDRHPLHGLYGGENAYLRDEYCKAISDAGFRLTRIIATYESEINLYPVTFAELKKMFESRLSFTIPEPFFKKLVLPLLNLVHNEPGRLYTFIGWKP